MTTRKLGFGDFVHDGPNPMARSLYLHAVTRCVPEAIQALCLIEGASTEWGEATPSLCAWAREWGFEDPWALDCARTQSEHWRNHPTMIGHWNVVGVFWEPVFPEGPSWNPTSETEAAFRRRVEAYIATVKASPGIRKAPEKREPRRGSSGASGAEHFEWLALHHVKRLTQSQVAERCPDRRGISIASVSEAITTTADLIGLTLRPAPGRKLG